jgi:hypothetical protein
MKYVAVRICFLIISLIPFCLKAQIFTNSAPQWGITQHNWDGVYGSGVSTLDWNMDGWDDLTFGNSSGGLRTFINNQGNGFTSIHLPIIQQTESKSIKWLDIDGGVIGSADMLVIIAEYGCLTNCSIDFNSNGSTDINDLLFLLAIFGESC